MRGLVSKELTVGVAQGLDVVPVLRGVGKDEEGFVMRQRRKQRGKISSHLHLPEHRNESVTEV